MRVSIGSAVATALIAATLVVVGVTSSGAVTGTESSVTTTLAPNTTAHPPRNCYITIEENAVREWDGGSVGWEWIVYDWNDDIISYGKAPDYPTACRRAVTRQQRHEGCVLYIDPNDP